MDFRIKMGCREICSNYAVKKINPKVKGIYESGHKRCSRCEYFLIWNGNYCPCCGVLLRVKPRNSMDRIKMIQSA